MAATYVHLAGKDVEEKLISIYTGKKVEAPMPEFRPLICSRCEEKNTPGQRYCFRCGTPLLKDELSRSSIEIEDMRMELSEIKDILLSLQK